MKNFKMAFAVAALAIAGMATDASAGILNFIQASEGNSWTSRWEIDTTNLTGGDFDRVEITVNNNHPIETTTAPFIGTTTSTFDKSSDVMSVFNIDKFGFNGGTWAMTTPTTVPGPESPASFSAAAATASTKYLAFNVHSTDDTTDGIRFTVETYLGTTLVGVGAAGFRTPTLTTEAKASQFKLVPLPPAAFMGLALLGGLGLMTSRRRRNAIQKA